MVDYEALILERQELQEIWEDDPDSPFLMNEEGVGPVAWWDSIPEDEFEVLRRR